MIDGAFRRLLLVTLCRDSWNAIFCLGCPCQDDPAPGLGIGRRGSGVLLFLLQLRVRCEQPSPPPIAKSGVARHGACHRCGVYWSPHRCCCRCAASLLGLGQREEGTIIFLQDMCVIVLDLYQVQQPQSTKHQALVTPVGRLSCVKYDFIVPPLQLQCESKCRRLMRPSKRPTSTSRALLPSGMLGCRFHQDQPQKYKSKLSEGIQAPH